jgi:hypothetical protein
VDVPDIQSLTARAHDLSQKVDWWNNAMVWALVAGAIIAAAVVITTRMVIVRAGQLADVQEEIIAAVNERAGGAIERAATANERAGKLEGANIQLRIDLESATAESTRRQTELEVE